jgi:putative spermidine/putrescine transport system permease protein
MNATSPVLRGLAALVYLLLLAPVAIVVVISFSADSFIVFPPPASRCAGTTG